MFSFNNISIHWLGHDGFLFEKGPLSIYIDPFRISDAMVKPASLVLLTHEHFDHCSVEDLRKIVTPKTIIVCSQECLSTLSKVEPGEIIPLKPGEKHTVAGVTITAVPAYNLDKYRDAETKMVYHPKQDEKNGYIITLGDTILYHAGDSDFIPEMKGIRCDVAMLPVSGTYVMTVEEAVRATKSIKPKVAIPMHYGTIVGSEEDAERFKTLLLGEGEKIDVKILKREE